MVFTPADPFSVAIFCLFCAVMVGVIAHAVWKIDYRFPRFSALFGGYLILFTGVVMSGLPRLSPLPVIPLLFLSVILSAVVFAFSNYGGEIANTFGFAALLGFQSFRLPLELILHHWADIGTVPPTMTWTGSNWDVVTGLISLAGIPLVARFKAAAWVVQMIGFILLINVFRVVIFSSPVPFAWPLEQPIQLIGYMPYALIGPLFVGPALAGHLIVFRKLCA